MSTMTYTEQLTVVHCTCGIAYAIPDSLERQLQSEKPRKSTYCPNGHEWHYLGKSHEQEVKELRDRVAQERARRDQAEADAQAARAREGKERKARKRLETRAAAGVCPCCNRTFQQLARHMKSKHPDFQP